MGKRAKLTLPWHIKVNLNLKTGFYEGVENRVTYQLNFSQLNDLKIYNAELLDKPRLLAITKADLIDEELESMIRKELPEDIPTIFISAVSQRGLTELKDMIWKTLNPTEEEMG